MKRLLMVGLMVVMLSSVASAVNTITYGTDGHIAIIPDGATDYSVTTDTNLGSPSGGIYISYLLLIPSAVNDKFVFFDGTVAGAVPFITATSIDGGTLVFYPNKKVKLTLDASACTFGTAANARIIIGFKYSPGSP